MVSIRWLITGVLVAGGVIPASAQHPLSLAEALDRADRLAYPNRIAAGARQAREGDGDAAWRGILPTARVEAGWVRTTDPLAAFGTTLRQRAVTPAAFDPVRLNHPDPISGVGSALVVEQPLVNLDAWAGRRAARAANGAAAASQRWTAAGTRVQVVAAWFGGVLAAERVATLEAAVAAARSHVRQARALLEQGMVTRADLLLAEVKAGELEADLAAARGDRSLATRGLAVLLGTPDDTTVHLPAALPGLEALAAALASLDRGERTAEVRGDVVAASLGRDAALADLQRTRAALLPRINGFARYDWNTADAVFGGSRSWTVGVMASWAPFSGGAELAAMRAARGRSEMAAAAAEAADAQASLDVANRDNALAVARTRLGIANQAVEQSTEAHRLVGRSYAGGLATVTELLGAAAAETASRLARSAAVYQVILSAAERQHARGQSLDFLIALGR